MLEELENISNAIPIYNFYIKGGSTTMSTESDIESS